MNAPFLKKLALLTALAALLGAAMPVQAGNRGTPPTPPPAPNPQPIVSLG